MKRDFSSLARPGLDLLVVGSGIYGAWTAVDQVMTSLAQPTGARPTEERRFPWAPSGAFGDWLQAATTRGVAHNPR